MQFQCLVLSPLLTGTPHCAIPCPSLPPLRIVQFQCTLSSSLSHYEAHMHIHYLPLPWALCFAEFQLAGSSTLSLALAHCNGQWRVPPYFTLRSFNWQWDHPLVIVELNCAIPSQPLSLSLLLNQPNTINFLHEQSRGRIDDFCTDLALSWVKFIGRTTTSIWKDDTQGRCQGEETRKHLQRRSTKKSHHKDMKRF